MSWLRRNVLYHFGLVVVAFSYAWCIAAFVGAFLYSLPLWHDALARLWGMSVYPYLVAVLYYGVLDSFTDYEYRRSRRNQANRVRGRSSDRR